MSRIAARRPSGSFVQTLTLTDVATGWTECAPLLFREQRLLGEVMTALRPALPFPLLGFDTDNDSVFMNETIKDWCEAAQVDFTRSRPYRKNDQAHVEQSSRDQNSIQWIEFPENGAVVRRMVGYRRYAGIAAATELARLYRDMRLYVNFFQPSFKLMEKTRDGARVTKRYHAPLTPFQRVQAHPAVAQASRDELAAQFTQLDPVVLLHDIRPAQARLTALADTTRPLEPTPPRRTSKLSSRVCAMPGRRGRSGRRRGKSHPSPEGAGALIRSPKSPTTSRHGSTRTRHKPGGSSWAGFRPPSRTPILTG